MMDIFAIETNEILLQFAANNAVLIGLIYYALRYVCKKTPWAWDDDLPSFFAGAIDKIRGRKNG